MEQLTDFGIHARCTSAQATEPKDADTAAIFTEIGQRHRQMVLARRDEPAMRQLSRERLHLTLVITLRRYP